MLRLDPALLRRAAGFGIVWAELCGWVGITLWLGSLADRNWNTAPFAAIGCTGIGFAIAMFRIRAWSRRETKRVD